MCVCVCARARARACVVCARTNVQARKSADLESKKGLLNAHRDGMIQPLLRLTRHCSHLPLQPFISTHLLCVCVCVRARARTDEHVPNRPIITIFSWECRSLGKRQKKTGGDLKQVASHRAGQTGEAYLSNEGLGFMA